MVKALFSFELHQLIMSLLLVIVGILAISILLPQPSTSISNFRTFSRKANLVHGSRYTEVFDFKIEGGYVITQFYFGETCYSYLARWGSIEDENSLIYNKAYKPYLQSFPNLESGELEENYYLCLFKEIEPGKNSAPGTYFLNKIVGESQEVEGMLSQFCNSFFDTDEGILPEQVENNTLTCFSLDHKLPVSDVEGHAFHNLTGPITARYVEFLYGSDFPHSIRFFMIENRTYSLA